MSPIAETEKRHRTSLCATRRLLRYITRPRAARAPPAAYPRRTKKVRILRWRRQRDALDGAGSPRLVLVREPDQLGVERAHPPLAFGLRLVELAEPHRHVAADDDRAPARLDDDHLHAACVARRRDEPESRHP